MIAVKPLQMDKSVARQKYEEYKQHCKSKHTSEDRGIMLGYRALSEGKSVIDLYEIMRVVPCFENGLPKLAIGRAHWTQCWYSREDAGNHAFFATQRGRYFNRDKHGYKHIVIPSTVMHQAATRCYTSENDGKRYHRSRPEEYARAIVPIIPANIRPKTSLERYHILWEAEWETVPHDPLLLRHLYGSVYAVLAQWDLTPLERMVLSHRLGQ